MRIARLTVQSAAIALLLLGTACHTMEVTHETFISQSNPSHLLKLESKPSLKIAVFGTFHNIDSVGDFVMETEKGTIQGSYTYVNNKGERGYVFHPNEGERWEATLTADGTFTDGNGLKWRIQQVKYQASPIAEKHLVKIGG